MEVFRGREASLESSKGSYRGSRSSFTIPKIHTRNQWKSMWIHENLKKIIKLIEIRWKSSEDKKLAWKRANVCIGAASRPLPFQRSIPKINESLDKSRKIYKKFIKRDESHQRTTENKTPSWNRAHDTIAAAGRSPPSWAPVTRNLWKSLKIDKNHQILWTLWKSIKNRSKVMQIRENLQKSI